MLALVWATHTVHLLPLSSKNKQAPPNPKLNYSFTIAFQDSKDYLWSTQIPLCSILTWDVNNLRRWQYKNSCLKVQYATYMHIPLYRSGWNSLDRQNKAVQSDSPFPVPDSQRSTFLVSPAPVSIPIVPSHYNQSVLCSHWKERCDLGMMSSQGFVRTQSFPVQAMHLYTLPGCFCSQGK